MDDQLSPNNRTGPDGLTDRQRKFVVAYAGNGAEAARLAGYRCKNRKVENNLVNRLLKIPAVVAAIKAREKKEETGLVMNRQERQAFWTAIAKDPKAETKDRLRASELLARSEGDFLERVETTHTMALPPGLGVEELRALATMSSKGALTEGVVVEGELLDQALEGEVLESADSSDSSDAG